MKSIDTMKTVKATTIEGSKTLETWQKEQLMVATGVTTPEESPHSATYVALIEELEAENRMLRSRNERLTMAMKHMDERLTMAMKQMGRILMENTR